MSIIANHTFSKALKNSYDKAVSEINDRQKEMEYVNRAKNGDLAARDALFNLNIGLIVREAGKKNYRGPADDLVAASFLELDKAVRDFDPECGVRFGTFFLFRAVNAMNKLMYKDSTIVAPENLVKENRVEQSFTSMDQPMQGFDGLTMGDTISDENDIFDEICKLDRTSLVRKLLNELDETERKLLTLLYLDEARLSEREIAKLLGVTHTTVQNKRNRILLKIRASKQYDALREYGIAFIA